MTFRIVTSLGTDHHRFDRLVDWLEQWLVIHDDVECVLQHGHSRPSSVTTNRGVVSRDEVLRLMREADLVITQAGPGSIFDAHEAGLLPVVVARRHVYGEVVDDHQVLFATLMETRGECVVARDRAGLHALLDRACQDPGAFRWKPRPSPATATAAEVRRRMMHAVEQGPGWVFPSRVPESIRARRRRPAVDLPDVGGVRALPRP